MGFRSQKFTMAVEAFFFLSPKPHHIRGSSQVKSALFPSASQQPVLTQGTGVRLEEEEEEEKEEEAPSSSHSSGSVSLSALLGKAEGTGMTHWPLGCLHLIRMWEGPACSSVTGQGESGQMILYCDTEKHCNAISASFFYFIPHLSEFTVDGVIDRTCSISFDTGIALLTAYDMKIISSKWILLDRPFLTRLGEGDP